MLNFDSARAAIEKLIDDALASDDPERMWAGSRRRYVPDFLVRLAGGTILALEIKGTDSPQNKAKRDALNEWMKAVNAAGGFGHWKWDVAFKPGNVQDIITKHAAVVGPSGSS